MKKNSLRYIPYIFTAFFCCCNFTFLSAQTNSTGKPQAHAPDNLNQGDVLSNLADKIDYRNIKKADLKFQNLTQFPDQLLKCTNIEEIDLAYNSISEIPAQIGQLKHLRRLYLNANKLQTLPESIFTNLPNLEVLFIQNNKKDFVLSDKIGKLQNLSYLFTSDLVALPPTVWQLYKLQTLRVWRAKVFEIPNDIKNLSQLQVICFRENYISQISPEIYKLSQLTYFSFGDNHLTQIPTEINQLKNLEYIAVFGNPIQTLPIDVAQLPKLSIVSCWETDMNENTLSSISKQFSNVKMFTSKEGLH